MTNRFPAILALSVLALSSSGCATRARSDQGRVAAPRADGPVTTEPAGAAPVPAGSATLVVHGMSCPLCASNVDQQLLAVPGVEDVRVDMGTGRVRVRFDPARPPSTESLERAVERSGFTLASIERPEGSGR